VCACVFVESTRTHIYIRTERQREAEVAEYKDRYVRKSLYEVDVDSYKEWYVTMQRSSDLFSPDIDRVLFLCVQ